MTLRGDAPSRLAALLLAALLGAGPALARADPPEKDDDVDAVRGGTRALSTHFGIEVARALLRGGDATDPLAVRAELIRGVARAAGLGTEEGARQLVAFVDDPHGPARSDSRVLLATVRALAPFAERPPVARALGGILEWSPAPEIALRQGAGDESPLPQAPDTDRAERLDLARATAAFALARAGTLDAMQLLMDAARSRGAAEAVAVRALREAPRLVVPPLPALSSRDALTLMVDLGDLRAADAALEASRSVERSLRLAGLRGVGKLGDTRGIEVAESALSDDDPAVREAAGEALVDLGAPGAEAAVVALIEGEKTARVGVDLASRVHSPDVTGALAARVRVSSDVLLRRTAIAALGAQRDPGALSALEAFVREPVLAGDAAEALARSRIDGAWDAIARALGDPRVRTLGARMAGLRGAVSGSLPRSIARQLDAMAGGRDAASRRVAVQALVLAGERSERAALDDHDVAVRRLAAMACDPLEESGARRARARLEVEGDDDVKTLLVASLIDGGRKGPTTTALAQRLRLGGIDAPVAGLLLAQEAGDGDEGTIDAALSSLDPLIRASVARGLARSREPWAVGRLAAAYDEELDTGVRRAIVEALASRTVDAFAPLRAHTLVVASETDPDAGIRTVAERARSGQALGRPAPGRDVVWLRVMTSDGAPPPLPLVRGILVRPDGLALPVIFDEEGYALVRGPSAEEGSRLVLAPRLGSYESLGHADGARAPN